PAEAPSVLWPSSPPRTKYGEKIGWPAISRQSTLQPVDVRIWYAKMFCRRPRRRNRRRKLPPPRNRSEVSLRLTRRKSISLCELKSPLAGTDTALCGLVQNASQASPNSQRQRKMRLRSLGLAVITSAITALAVSGCAVDATAPSAPVAPANAPSRSL